MSQMLDALSDLFEEDLVPGISDHYAGIDKTFSQLITSSERVVMDELTKGYKAIHTFATSLAGAIRAGNPNGPTMLSDTGASQIISAHDTYPGVSEIPLPGLGNRYITIAKLRGNVTMNLAMLRAQQLHTVGDYPGLVLKQLAKLIAHNEAVAWYLNDSAQVVKLDVTGTGADLTRSGQVITCTGPTAGNVFTNGRYRRVLPGIEYDVWKADANMTACYTTHGFAMLSSHVDMFDPSSCTLYFSSEADAIALKAAFDASASDLWLVPYGAIPDRTSNGVNASILPCGYKWWVRETGTLYGGFGDLNVANYGSMFKSMSDALSASLTEAVLNKYISSFEQAVDVKLDTIVMPNGVLVNLLDSYGADATASSSIVRLNRDQSSAANVGLGWDSLGYTYGGRVFDINVSEYISSGEVLITKVRDGNLIRYEPPRVDGTDANVAGVDPRVEWLGKKFYDNIWMPSTAVGGGPTDGVVAPFDRLVQHAAKEVRSILLTSVTETTV